MSDQQTPPSRAGEYRQKPPAPPAVDPAVVAAEEHARTMRLIRRVIGAVVVVLLVLYFNGALDRTLAPIGLNFHECATNGFGATFCGDELKRYRHNVTDPLQRLQDDYSYGR